MTAEQIADEIDRLQTLIGTGMGSFTSDGESVSFDQAAARRRLAELLALQSGQRHRARQVRTTDLRGAF